MQRLLSLRKLHFHTNLSNPFTSLTPPQPLNTHQSFCSLLTRPHPWRSDPSHLEKLNHGFLPHQFPVRRLVTIPSSSLWKLVLSDHRIGFLRFQPFRSHSGSRGAFDSITHSGKQWFRGLSSDQVVLGLIGTNVAVFLLWRIADQVFMMKNFMISLDNIKSGHLHTIVTHAFSHVSAGHLISNMIGLYFFGNNIARVFGVEALLKLYLAGAIGGAVFYLLHHAYLATKKENQLMFMMDPSRRPALGARGAVNAIMLLVIFLPKNILYLEFIIPVPAILLGIFLVGKDVLRIIEGDSEISGSARLGGAAVAALAWARVRRRGRLF